MSNHEDQPFTNSLQVPWVVLESYLKGDDQALLDFLLMVSKPRCFYLGASAKKKREVRDLIAKKKVSNESN